MGKTFKVGSPKADALNRVADGLFAIAAALESRKPPLVEHLWPTIEPPFASFSTKSRAPKVEE